MNMSKKYIKQHKKILLPGITILIAAVGLTYFLSQGDRLNDGIARETDLKTYYMDADRGGTPTGINGVSISRQDQRASDGPFTCMIYKTDSRLVLATYSIGGGLTPPGTDSRPKLTYYSNELSQKQIDDLVNKYCDDTPGTYVAPQPDR